MSDLFPVEIIAAIKGTRSDQDGAWTLTLALDKTQAGKAATLSLYNGILFKATFVPESEAQKKEMKL